MRSSRGLKGAALVAAGAIGGGAAIAVGSVPDSGGVIHACYEVTTTTGGVTIPASTGANLRIIDPDAGQSCHTVTSPAGAPVALERAISWNQTGPAGPAGAAGTPGAPGAAGASSAAKPVGHVVFSSSAGLSADLGGVTVGFEYGGLKPGFEYGGKAKLPTISLLLPAVQVGPTLSQAAIKGTKFKTITVVVYQTNTTKPLLTYVLGDGSVTKIDGSFTSGDGTPTERITLNFSKISEQAAGQGKVVLFNKPVAKTR